MECKTRIEGTNDIDITYALAYLAGFRERTYIGKVNNLWHRDLSQRATICFHKDTLEKTGGSITEAIAYFGPDIIVSQIHRQPRGDERDWQPTNEYLIDFNKKIIDKSLVEKIQEEIMRVYS